MGSTVKVEALQPHTTAGVAYQPGDHYDIDADLVDTVIVQGKAKRAEPGEAGTRVTKASTPSRPVTPMTTSADLTPQKPAVVAAKKK